MEKVSEHISHQSRFERLYIITLLPFATINSSTLYYSPVESLKLQHSSYALPAIRPDGYKELIGIYHQ